MMDATEAIIETWFPKTLYICNELHKEQLSVYRKEILRLKLGSFKFGYKKL